MSDYDPSGYFSQFGGVATTMVSQFAGGNATDPTKSFTQKAGGAGALAAGAIGAAGGIVEGAMRIKNADSKKEKAQGGIDIAASAAGAAGPWGQVAAAPLKLISALMDIKGPRERRRERREKDRVQQYGMQQQAGKAGIRGSNPSRSAGIAASPITTVPLGTPAPSFESV